MTTSPFAATHSASQTVDTYIANNDGDWVVATRSVRAFAPHANYSPDLAVALDAGYVYDGAELVEVSAQNTASLTAPSSNPRHDIVYIDSRTGAVGVATGEENESPSDPELPPGKSPIARITWVAEAPSITDSMLTDLRALNFVGLPPQIQNQTYTYAADSGSANAYVASVSPAPASLAAGQRAVFKAVNANSGSSTFDWCGLGAQTIKKFGGGANLTAGDIVADQIVDVEYDGTNWQMMSPTGAASFVDPTTTRGDLIVRGASAVQRLAVGAANQILATDGTDPVWRSLSNEIDSAIGSTRGQVLARGASAWTPLSIGGSNTVLKSDGTDPNWSTLSALIDGAIGSTRGQMLARGASAWTPLSVGASNTVLKSDGADPGWSALSSVLDGAIGSTQGAILYRGGSSWSALSPGTNGQFLKTQGSSANPVWADASGGATTVTTSISSGSSVTITNAIPSTATNIVVTFSGVSTTSNNVSIGAQLGDSGGIETTGYLSLTYWADNSTPTMTMYNSTTHVLALPPIVDNTFTYGGYVHFYRTTSSGSQWVADSGGFQNGGTPVYTWGYANKTVSSGPVTSVALATSGTFDAGEASVTYW